MNNSKKIISLLILLILLAFQACGGGSSNQNESAQASSQKEDGLSKFELEHGIGPIKEVVDVGQLNPALAEKGQELFQAKCTACHRANERYIGPRVDEILDRRSPTYVMNMIMNPDEMTKKHPEAKKMLQEYLSPMPFQNVTVDEARAIVEYFRTIEKQEES